MSGIRDGITPTTTTTTQRGEGRGGPKQRARSLSLSLSLSVCPSSLPDPFLGRNLPARRPRPAALPNSPNTHPPCPIVASSSSIFFHSVNPRSSLLPSSIEGPLKENLLSSHFDRFVRPSPPRAVVHRLREGGICSKFANLSETQSIPPLDRAGRRQQPSSSLLAVRSIASLALSHDDTSSFFVPAKKKAISDKLRT